MIAAQANLPIRISCFRIHTTGDAVIADQIQFVTNQQRRFGSCTPANGTIRISDRVAKMPPWVRDYVLVHELAHLEQANHSRAFWRLVERYPLTERARGYLIAVGLDDERGAGDAEPGA